jgi:hypothetical protein
VAKKENVINDADTKDLAKKHHVKNLTNGEDSTIVVNARNITTSPYNINKEQSNHDPQILLTVTSSLVNLAAFGKMNCI